jgi:hypothetical protein
MTNTEPKYVREQCRDLVAFFNEGKSCTIIEAATKLGIGALPRRISDLQDQGYPIRKEWEHYVGRSGKLKRRMRYSKMTVITTFQSDKK